MKIACVGDNCIDRYDDLGKESPGGNPVNVAVYAKRLGFDSSYIGAVGDDGYGELIISAIRSKGVDVSHVRTAHGSSTVSHVTMKDGERIFGDYDEGVMADFRPTEEDIDFMCGHDMVVTDLWGHSEEALEEIHKRGIPVAFDASTTVVVDCPDAAAADWLSSHFAQWYGKACTAILELTFMMLIIWWNIPKKAADIIICVLIGIVVVTMALYFRFYAGQLKGAKDPEKPEDPAEEPKED